MTDTVIGENASEARLLVVDDNDDNRYTLVMRLEIEGYCDITTAEDGEQALALLREREFDLVLLDVMMPKVDGYQVLGQLKAEARLHTVPVIMISALDEMSSVIRCIELGAEDYLPKPFDPVLLRARISASLEKKRLRDALRGHLARIESELEAARQLQLGMVPRVFPEPDARCPVEIAAMMEPAREVGGDLYDFFEIEDGRICILIGDVCDKGVPSALFMARTKNVIRLVARLLRAADGSLPEPAEMLAAINRELSQDNAAMMFVTLFFAILSPRTGELRFANAGHNLPYRIAQTDVTAISAGTGLPLGVRRNSKYESGFVQLSPGDTLYLYTDGVTEAGNMAGEFFAEARLEAALKNLAGSSSEQIVNGVADAVYAYVAGAPQTDDITAMAVRLVPEFCAY